MPAWYYVSEGARFGPVDEAVLADLIREGRVVPETLVWTEGASWASARSSSVGYLFQHGPDAPPPIPPAAVDNRLAWALALTPVLFGFVDYALRRDANSAWASWIWFATNVIFVTADTWRLRVGGHAAPSNWWALLVPVYLVQRSRKLGHRFVIPAIWVGAFGFALCAGYAGSRLSVIENTSCRTVSKIILDAGGDPAICTSVFLREVGFEDEMSGIAYLSDNTVVEIRASVQGDQVITQFKGPRIKSK